MTSRPLTRPHPRGLFCMCGVEVFERFSFYATMAVFIYYLYWGADQGGLGMDVADATALSGAFCSVVYLTAAVGGWIADRIYGLEKVLFIALAFCFIGYLSLALVPGMFGVAGGVLFVGFGTGGVKVVSASITGQLYDPDDPLLDGGFSYLYLFINVGAFFGPLVAAVMRREAGFHWAFGLSAMVMVAALVLYLLTRDRLVSLPKKPPYPLEENMDVESFTITAFTLTFAVLVGFGAIPVVGLPHVAALAAFCIAVFVFFQLLTQVEVGPSERRRVVGYVPMFVAMVVFYAVFKQRSTVLAVYYDRRVDRNVFGYELSPEMINALNPLFVIALGWLLAWVFTRLGHRQPTTPTKYGVGIILTGIAMLLFIPYVSTEANSTPLLVIAGIILLFTISELLLNPTGQSLVTRMAPAAFPARMMALQNLAQSIGASVAGSVGGFYISSDPVSEMMYFSTIGIITVTFGVLLMLLKTWMDAQFQGDLGSRASSH
ncbi:MAG: oligopeptide:H+ symporter [Corynebacterium sp.]|nr:oligopeptide:H+ symporter [Corynebacterium sp.]